MGRDVVNPNTLTAVLQRSKPAAIPKLPLIVFVPFLWLWRMNGLESSCVAWREIPLLQTLL